MKVSDYIVSFLIKKGITDVFGYPGGMITHLMDSLSKESEKISSHLNYHEQASAFCACGYAAIKKLPGVAYATSGPGATNLITGIANAYYDSTPCIFITGQVNTYEAKGNLKIRQKGFQETDIVSIVKPITKYAVYVKHVEDIRYEIEKCYAISKSGRPGPTLIDIPFDIQRSDINPDGLRGYALETTIEDFSDYHQISENFYAELSHSKNPLILAGAGIDKSGSRVAFRQLIEKLKIPVITTMIAIDTLPENSPYNFGFLGAYGHRYANIIQEKADLLICIGSRLDTRQTGINTKIFSTNSKIIRFDISEEELTNKIKESEISVHCDIKRLIDYLVNENRFSINDYSNWRSTCTKIKKELYQHDNRYPNQLVHTLGTLFPNDCIITTDVGQNQVWVAQSLGVKENQQILFSGGHGAMGYSLPAAIGAFFAAKKTVISINGDGGLMMNLQELQFIKREQLPIIIIVLNNHSLGMIRHFQEMYFNGRFTQTIPEEGFVTPDYCKIADAFGIKSINVTNMLNDVDEINQIKECIVSATGPVLINIECGGKTYVFPKLAMGEPIYNQEPQINKKVLDGLLKI